MMINYLIVTRFNSGMHYQMYWYIESTSEGEHKSCQHPQVEPESSKGKQMHVKNKHGGSTPPSIPHRSSNYCPCQPT